MKFEYERRAVRVEAYGKEYEIPTKTVAFVNEVNEAAAAISAAKTAEESVKAAKSGVAVFIGEEEADRIYPDISQVDTDEISAFWWLLNSASNAATKAVIAKYMPESVIRNVQH